MTEICDSPTEIFVAIFLGTDKTRAHLVEKEPRECHNDMIRISIFHKYFGVFRLISLADEPSTKRLLYTT